MKIFFKWILLLCFLFSVCFARSKLDISTDKDIYFLDDIINLRIDLDSDKILSFNLKNIVWIENFDILHKSSSSSFQIVNWEKKSNVSFIFSLLPKDVWNFSLWPVFLKNWNNELESNVIKIKVEKKEKSIKNLIDSKNNENLEDIHDIETVRFFWFNDFILYFVLLFFFFILFFFILNKYFKKIESENKASLQKENFYDKNLLNIISRLKKLKESSSILEKKDFYEKLNLIFRDYFKFSWIKLAENMSLNELYNYASQIVNWKVVWLDIFKKSYFYEFNNNKDNLEDRKKIIDDFINLINNF